MAETFELPTPPVREHPAYNAEPPAKSQTDNALGRRIAEAADHIARSSYPDHMSWKAVGDALRLGGIDAPRGTATDIQAIPDTTRMPVGTKLQPGDIVVTGATDKHPKGNSFVVNEDMKAVSNHIRRIPDLTKLSDVRIFRPDHK
jgi:hypothetical protein